MKKLRKQVEQELQHSREQREEYDFPGGDERMVHYFGGQMDLAEKFLALIDARMAETCGCCEKWRPYGPGARFGECTAWTNHESRRCYETCAAWEAKGDQ